MTEQGVGKWLRRHGFTPQRPARRAYQQKPEVVRRGWTHRVPRYRRSHPQRERYGGLDRSVRAVQRRRPAGA
ncbi:winged helix-turn-helix domain-containing protein [Nocardia sp. NPDC004260]